MNASPTLRKNTRFPWGTLQSRANRMLVMKALRQDVANLAFHPHDTLRGLQTVPISIGVSHFSRSLE